MKMKSLFTHTFCIAIGFSLATFIFLVLSSFTSFVWQDSLKIKSSNLLQIEGAKRAKNGDFSMAEHLFRASDLIQKRVQPRQWNISYPLHGWRAVAFVKDPDTTFYFSDLCVEAYLLDKQGKMDEANNIYTELLKLDPSKDKVYFQNIAIQMLSAYEKA